MSGRKYRKAPIWAAAFILLVVFVYFFPIFHLVSLTERQAAEADAAFDPVGFVETFWSEELLPALDKAVDAEILIASLTMDPSAAREQFAHQVGLSNAHYYFVKGEATLVEKGEYELKLSLDDGQPDIIIEAGPVFGNTLRDGSGLLDVNDFPNSQEFNLISAELNKRVEDVLARLWQEAELGEMVIFLGCVEVLNPATDHFPMKVVPVIANVK